MFKPLVREMNYCADVVSVIVESGQARIMDGRTWGGNRGKDHMV